MVKGIGIDMVRVEELDRLMKAFPAGVFKHIFSEDELAAAQQTPRPVVSLAVRFGVKEAVFKAVAHLTQRKGFDLRIVESLNASDGYPYVKVNDKLRNVLDEAGVERLLISASTEGDYVVVIALAEG